MPDERFYVSLGPLRAEELARATGAELTNPGLAMRPILRVAPLARAGAPDVAFLADRRYRDRLSACAAGAIFVRPAEVEAAPEGCAVLVTADPQLAYSRAARLLHKVREVEPGEAIHPDAEIEEGVRLASGVVIGAGVRIGSGTTIGPNSVIAPGVAIGRDCHIGANVFVCCALVGDSVRLYAGAVIGEAGFGVAGHGGSLTDVPQLGRVILQDNVTVGAASCVDRGAWEDTSVGENTKIDNLVQIAHNVRIGRNCVLAAQVGISGSVTVGDGVMFGGGAGVADHLRIGDGARIAAHAGIMKDVPAGEAWGGAPARPLRRFMRETAWLAREVERRKEASDK